MATTLTRARKSPSSTIYMNCWLHVVSPPGKTSMTSLLNCSRINRWNQEAGIGLLQDMAHQQGAKLAAWRDVGATLTRPMVCWRTRRTPGRAPLSSLGSMAQSAHTQTIATTNEPVMCGASQCPCRHRTTQSAFAAARLCHRPVPSCSPRPSHLLLQRTYKRRISSRQVLMSSWQAES